MKTKIFTSLLYFKTFLFLTVFGFEAFSADKTLSDKNIEVVFNETLINFSVTDKRCGKTWEQLQLKEEFRVESVVQQGAEKPGSSCS